jgi:NTP pyrophosphatase (non-canonical NTP hydrolase)
MAYETNFTFKDYEKLAQVTAQYPNIGSNIDYPTLGLCGEAGETANKVKKIARDFGGIISEESRLSIIEELGDTLWYVAMVAFELNVSMEEVAKRNIEKLKSRYERGVIKGKGDYR